METKNMEYGSLNPEEARNKAQEIHKTAADMEELLNKVKVKMENIDNEEHTTYRGTRKASELLAELEELIATFHYYHETYDKYANEVELAVATYEEQ